MNLPPPNGFGAASLASGSATGCAGSGREPLKEPAIATALPVEWVNSIWIGFAPLFGRLWLVLFVRMVSIGDVHSLIPQPL